MGQIYKEKAFLVSAYLEGLVYVTLYLYINPSYKMEDGQSCIVFLLLCFLSPHFNLLLIVTAFSKCCRDISYMGTMELQLEDHCFPILLLIINIIGITFNSIAVRVKLQSLKEAGMQTQDANIPVQTIGSMPLSSIRRWVFEVDDNRSGNCRMVVVIGEQEGINIDC
ncbi:hypothetical protein BDQ17DRAFT_1335883 [Cyathus striatus]|nr:hypothetical protein BDQ17DRAFT_1335883 [Cyathus striatus]